MNLQKLRQKLAEQNPVPKQQQVRDQSASRLASLVRAGLMKTSELPLLRQARLRLQKQQDIARLPKQHRDVLQKYNNAISTAVLGSQQSTQSVRRSLQNSFDVTQEQKINELALRDEMSPPPMMVLKRTGIRIFPDGRRVAMYVNQRLGLIFTIPYKESGKSSGEVIPGIQAEETDIEEVMESMDQVVKYASEENPKSLSKHFKFADGSKMPVAHGVAKALHMVHGALNDQNKEKFAAMLNDPKGFSKAADFAMSKVKYSINK